MNPLPRCPPGRPTSVCLLSFSTVSSLLCLLPQALAPVQSLTLAASSERTSEMALAARAEGAAPTHSQISVRAPLARPFMLLLYFPRARCLFSSGLVFLEPKSHSALRGTSRWLRPHLEPGLDCRRVGTEPGVSPPHAVLPLGLSDRCRTPSVCLVQLDSFLLWALALGPRRCP